MTVLEIRKKSGLKQVDFAKKFNIPLSTLSHWEKGHRQPPVYVVNLLNNAIESEKKLYDFAGYISNYFDSPNLYCNPDEVLKMYDESIERKQGQIHE